MLRRMQACKHLNNAVRCPMSSQAEKTECVRYVAGFFCLATPRISAIPSHMLTSLHPAQHIPPTLAPLRPASHPLRRVPVRLCEINVRMYAGRPYIRYLPPVRWSAKSPRGVICIGRVVGALLAYGRRLSLPSRRFPASPLPPESPATLFPCARRPCSAECANAHPAGVRASGGRARPATLFNCAGFPPPSLSHPCGAHFVRPYANAFPPPCGLRFAPPTPRKPACGEYEKGGRRGCFRFAGKYAHASIRKRKYQPSRVVL